MNNRTGLCGVLSTVVLLVAFPLAGCARPPSGSVHVGGDTLYINGRIDDAAADAVVAADFSRLGRVVIDSKGGSVTAAFRIADKLRTADIPLEVRRNCMSACATIILPASRIREMALGSTIALHGTRFGLHHLFLRTQRRAGHKLTQSARVKQLADREYALLKDGGIDPRLLMVPYVERGDMCYLEAEQIDGEKEFAIATEHATYRASTGTLARYGMRVRTIDGNGRTVDGDLRTYSALTVDDVEKQFNALDVLACDKN